MRGISIGQLAKSADVNVNTIRFYEKAGLLRPHVRSSSGCREYSELDLQQLKLIRYGRLLGFSLEELAELLACEGEPRPAPSACIEQKLLAVDRRIEELQRWRSCLLESRRDGAPMAARHSILNAFSDEAANAQAEIIEPASSQPVRDCNDED